MKRRRIDKEDDWVRKEIEFAFHKKITLVPFLIDCKLPNAEGLPGMPAELTKVQALPLSPSNWRNDLPRLVALMKEKGFIEANQLISIPTPVKDMLFPLALTIVQINEELKEFPGWKIVGYLSKKKQPRSGIAIEKVFEFRGLGEAYFSKTTESASAPNFSSIAVMSVTIASGPHT